MADLGIDMVHYMGAADDKCEFSLDDVHALAAEVIRHRAAKAADAERIRTMSEECARDVLDNAGSLDDKPSLRCDMSHLIAERIAMLLTGSVPMLSDEDARTFWELGQSHSRTTLAERDAIERLLADHGAKP